MDSFDARAFFLLDAVEITIDDDNDDDETSEVTPCWLVFFWTRLIGCSLSVQLIFLFRFIYQLLRQPARNGISKFLVAPSAPF